MGLMNEIKKLARPYAEDEEDFDEEYEDEVGEEEAVEPEAEEKPARAARAPKAERPAAKQTASRPAASNNGNVVNLRTGGNSKVILVEPETFDNVRDVADHLRNKCTIVLNLEKSDDATIRRLVDFLTGCAYVLDGSMQRVATKTYIIAPFNVDVVGNLKTELKDGGYY